MSIMKLVLFMIVLNFSFNQRLLSVIDIFRHGPRTPLTIDDITYRDILNVKWDTKRGELTNLGYQSQYLSGIYIRDKYGSLLSKEYKSSEFIMYCTEVNRTLLSGYSKIDGIFNNQIDNFVPMTLIYYPSPHDFSLCRGMKSYSLNNFSPKVKLNLMHYINNFQESIWYKIKDKINMDPKLIDLDDPQFLVKIADAVDVAYIEGKDLSHLKLSSQNITFLSNYKSYYSLFGRGNDEQIKIMSIPFLYTIIELIDEIYNQKSHKKYYGFSVHDASLISIFRILQFVYPNIDGMNIPFSSQLNIEVYDNKTITVVFNNHFLLNKEINQFKLDVLNVVGDRAKYDAFCGKDIDNPLYFKMFIFSLSIFILLLFTLIFVFIKYNNASYHEKFTEELRKNN